MDVIHDEIKSGEYECLVCLNSVTPKTPVYQCKSCFRVFHLNCTKEWAQKSVAKRGSWNCPHCLTSQAPRPENLHYRCWCGKKKLAVNAKRRLDTPHSCGQTCGAKRSCPHPCALTCHAGPHASSHDCLYMGPKIKCFCGKTSEQVICSMTRYGGFSCEQTCKRPRRTCKHKCSLPCHAGSCDENSRCDFDVHIRCFCGTLDETKPCATLSHNQRHKLQGRNKLTISCARICNAPLDCGKHFCASKCHGSKVSHACPFKPFDGETCFCGKTELCRQSCEDPRTACGLVCGKTLSCGHKCPQTCHAGKCAPCEQIVSEVACRCGATVQEAPCGSQPLCTRKCDALLTCKRHKCRRECCEFSPVKKRAPKVRNVSLEDFLAQTSLHSSAPPTSSEAEEAEQAAHFCPRMCGRLLACGSHTCPRMCHPGKCPPCLSTSFEEYVCPCGRTVLEPPIRCGTPLPICRAPCHREQACGHRAQHLCHHDSEPCQPCPLMVEVPCRCSKSMVKEKCSVVRSGGKTTKMCTEECGKQLPCGHICKKICCPQDESCLPCEDSCEHEFECGHLHEATCHYPEPCPETCTKVLTAVCPCKTTKCKYGCGEGVEIGCTDTCIAEAYPLFLLEAYDQEKRWFLQIEQQIRGFLRDNASKTLWFKPMSKRHRKYIYYMLEHYGLDGESVDFGENRSIRARRTDSAHLCRFVLQQASKREPVVYMDQIKPEGLQLEIDEAVQTSAGDEVTEEGFVEVSYKHGAPSPPSVASLDFVVVPRNQYLLLE